jgi:trk system potassium uptake protein TrkA
VNLLCCLIARKSNRKVKTIARVRNPIYLDEVSFFKEELGLTRVINPERAAAREIARLLRFPSAMKIDTLSGGMVELLKFKIAHDSPIKDKRIMDIAQNVHSEVLICAIERDNEVIIPNGSTMLLEGDRVSFIASPQNAAAFFHAIKIETHAVKDTLIIGGGRVGYYLAQRLLPVGIDEKIIEKDRKRCTELDELLKGATIINGDGTEETVVMEEGIETAESVVALQVPIGVGVKYKLAQRLNLTAELLMHITGSDKLDGIADPYGIKSTGMFKNTDCFTTLQVSLTYDLWARCKTCMNDED